jgi:hypothetical protein
VGTAVTIASLVYALKTQRDRVKLEQLVKAKLRGIAGSLVAIRKNPALAHKNIDLAMKSLELVQPNEMNGIVNYLAWAEGDSAATHRLLELLLLDVLSLQEGLFGTRIISPTDAEGESRMDTAAAD